MNVISLFSLAKRNLFRHWKHQIQVCFGIFLSVLIVMSVLLFIFFIRLRINQSIDSDAPCFLTYDNENGKLFSSEVSSEAEKIPGVNCALSYADYLLIYDIFQANPDLGIPVDLSFSNLSLQIGPKCYQYSASQQIEEQYDLTDFVQAYQIDDRISHFSDYASLYCETPFLYGRDLQSSDEILIPQQYLLLYGVPETEYAACIGQTLTLYAEREELALPQQYRICGIIREECFEGFPCSLVVKYDASRLSEFAMLNVYMLKYDMKQVEEVKRTLNEKLNQQGRVCGDYELIYTLQKQSGFVRRVLLVVAIIVALAVMLYLIVYIFFYIEQNKHYNALLLSVGMNARQIGLLNALEIMLNSSVATALGVTMGYFISYQIDCILNQDLCVIEWNGKLLCFAILVSSPIVTGLLSALIAMYTISCCRKIEPQKLFQE